MCFVSAPAATASATTLLAPPSASAATLLAPPSASAASSASATALIDASSSAAAFDAAAASSLASAAAASSLASAATACVRLYDHSFVRGRRFSPGERSVIDCYVVSCHQGD